MTKPDPWSTGLTVYFETLDLTVKRDLPSVRVGYFNLSEVSEVNSLPSPRKFKSGSILVYTGRPRHLFTDRLIFCGSLGDPHETEEGTDRPRIPRFCSDDYHTVPNDYRVTLLSRLPQTIRHQQ